MTKQVGYTVEQTAEVVSAYTAEPTKATVEALAAKLGKSAKSIVAKLSREGVYVSKAKKVGSTRVLKSDQIEALAKKMGVESEKLDSLEHVPARVIALITAHIAE